MFGNLLGWCISAVMLVGTFGGLLALNHSRHQISDPTSFSTTSGAANEITLPDGIDTLLPAEPGPADAAAMYQKAIAQCNADLSTFDNFAKTGRRDSLTLIQSALDLLVDASGNLPVAVFADTPDSVVNYKSDNSLTALRTCGDCLVKAALLAKVSNKTKAARTQCQAVYALGVRLAKERLTYLELSDGLGLMSQAADLMASIEDDAHHESEKLVDHGIAQTLADFTNQKLVPIQTVISSIDPPVVERNAGDVFWIAQNSKSKMWRIESILKLGRYKFDAPTRGDNKGAETVVTKMATTESDPAIKAAAIAARDLTMDQYQMLH